MGRSRPALLLIFILLVCALSAWWFRADLKRWLGAPEKGPPANGGRAQEQITDEDRKKLDEVLKRR